MATNQRYSPTHAVRMHLMQMKIKPRKTFNFKADRVIVGIPLTSPGNLMRPRRQKVGEFTFRFYRGKCLIED